MHFFKFFLFKYYEYFINIKNILRSFLCNTLSILDTRVSKKAYDTVYCSFLFFHIEKHFFYNVYFKNTQNLHKNLHRILHIISSESSQMFFRKNIINILLLFLKNSVHILKNGVAYLILKVQCVFSLFIIKKICVCISNFLTFSFLTHIYNTIHYG